MIKTILCFFRIHLKKVYSSDGVVMCLDCKRLLRGRPRFGTTNKYKAPMNQKVIDDLIGNKIISDIEHRREVKRACRHLGL